MLGISDAMAYRTLARAEGATPGTGPLTLLTVGPAAIARMAYQAGSDLAHDIIGAAVLADAWTGE